MEEDRFQKAGRLGQGTFGTVYKVSPPSDTAKKYGLDEKEKYALKRFFTNTPGERRVKNGVFSIREIQHCTHLSHRNICSTIGVVHERPFKKLTPRKDQRGDLAYLLFETAPHDLEDFLKKYWFPQKPIVDMILQICDGLEYLHNLGLMHRDMKLNNILVFVEDGKLVYKLADFGSIKPISRSGSESPRDITHVEYRAPEQLRERDDYGSEIDVWALGCLMFEILTGFTPFCYMGEVVDEEDLEKQMTNRKQLGRVLAITGIEGLDIRPKDRKLPYKEDTEHKIDLKRYIRKGIKEERIVEGKKNKNKKEDWSNYIDAICGCLKLIPSERWSISKVRDTILKDLPENDREEIKAYRKKLVDNKKKIVKTLIEVKDSNIRDIAISYIRRAEISERDHSHCIDIINRVTYKDQHLWNGLKKTEIDDEDRLGAKLAFCVATIVAKYWKIEEAYGLRRLFPEEKKLIKTFTQKELNDYELYILNDVLNYEVYRPNIVMLVGDTVSWPKIAKLIEGIDLHNKYVEDIALSLENQYNNNSPPRDGPGTSPSRNPLRYRNTQKTD